MAGPVSLELDPIFLKGLSYLHSKSKDSAEKLKALLDESLSRGSDTSYRLVQKDLEVSKGSVSKLSFCKQDSKSSSSSSSSSIGSKSSSEKSKKDTDRRSSEKVRLDMGDADPPKKPRLEKPDRSSPVTVQTSKDLLPNINDYDETNADDFAMEMGLACVVCRQMTVSMGNQLVECQECHNLYHQDCHKPLVTDKEVNDPRLVWYCARCTRQMKRMAQKPPQKPSPASASSAPVVIKDTLVKKTEFKTKPDTTSTFLAFKRTEVKTSTTSANPTSSNSSSSGSGLTGWAAFGAKTTPSLPVSAKLGSAGPSGSNKAMPTPPGQKLAGLSGLAGNKSGLGAAKIPGTGNGNGSTQVSLKPPPLTLGKQPLNRSSSSESQGKGSASSSGAGSPGSSQASPGASGTGGNNNGGSNGNNGNGSKVPPGEKAPTSQESQLNAMKRLQLVKKKAAQKKLKK
ncbi:integrator complex subunit 12 isoform X1 [Phyllopteryx taeniolatus]|uniref:integrator complex subunit 12 isoform X1 n=1 Tax=Phyllopteryx taeniolatus TaxID=161469 RepID=UPI002AD44771|nr:integrator complex subunit 12 isoform X1 [Phyllopteryx taeniolatus]XP_061626741.1 integrator complex subunit 12 isoform X1 [Phyllopteryx taeniolatus]